MFTPDITLPALREMRRKFGGRIYGRYGFADAFHPTGGWVNPDVIGIDLGITLLSAENLRTGRVWTVVHAERRDPARDGSGRRDPRDLARHPGPLNGATSSRSACVWAVPRARAPAGWR